MLSQFRPEEGLNGEDVEALQQATDCDRCTPQLTMCKYWDHFEREHSGRLIAHPRAPGVESIQQMHAAQSVRMETALTGRVTVGSVPWIDGPLDPRHAYDAHSTQARWLAFA